MTQDHYRDKYKTLKKGWNDSVSIYKNLVKNEITSDTTVLEAGCGFSNMYKKEYKIAKRVIGVDINPEYILGNDLLDEKIVSDLASFPQIKDDFVDLIISSWVLEHLENPDKVFGEFSRVLKKGGKIIFLTPNSNSYIVLINRYIPMWFRRAVATKLGGKLTVDPMLTFYKANTINKLELFAKNSNLKIEKLNLNGDPTYIAINNIFFHIGIFIERLLEFSFLNKTKVHIIGVMVKK